MLRGRHLALALCLAADALPAEDPTADAAAEEAVLREAEKIERSLVNLVARVQRSTVSVLTYRMVPPEPTAAKGADGKDAPKVERLAGVGSGFIVGRDGRIFTNVHVVAGHSRIEVVLHDGRVLPATEHAEVTQYDFALLICRADGLDQAEWAKSNLLQPGQFAIAAGNPRALAMKGRPVVTLGIVSGLGRLAMGGFDYLNAVQTDAEINPGNSGGPLYDLNGRIIGINGKIATTSEAISNVGVGFTIPARQVQNFLPDLLGGGLIEPGYSGLSLEDAGNGQGVRVKGVASQSPAAKAGLKPEDRITSLNGERIDSMTEWNNNVGMLTGGADMSVTFYRKDKVAVKKFELESRNKPLPKK